MAEKKFKLESARVAVHNMQDSLLEQVCGYLGFAMGMAWKAFILILVNENSFVQRVDDGDVFVLWLLCCFLSAIIVPIILLLNWRRSILQRSAREHLKRGKKALFITDRAAEQSYTLLINWALVWVLVVQLDSAVRASAPTDWIITRVVGFVCTLAAFALPIVVLRTCFPQEDSIFNCLADSLVSGSGFAYAFLFIATYEAALNLDEIQSSDHVVRMIIYSLGISFLSGLILAWIAYADLCAVAQSLDRLEGRSGEEEEDIQAARKLCTCGIVGEVMRELAAPAIGMANGSTMYNIFYISALRMSRNYETVNMRQPMRPLHAGVFMVMSLVSMFFMGKLIQCLSLRAQGKLNQIDTSTQSGITSSLVAQVTGDNFVKALASGSTWVAGMSIHQFGVAFWTEFVADGRASWKVKGAVWGAYSMLLTMICTALMFWITLPPPQSFSEAELSSSRPVDKE